MIKKLFILLTLITNLNAQYSWYLNNQVEYAQKELNANYSKLIKTGLIDKSLTINVNPTKRCFKSEGLKLLELIQILQDNPTEQSIKVLDKLHNLYYLEFYKFINNLKITQEEKIKLSSTLSDLFLPNLKKIDLQTFNIRNILTKSFIQMIIINKTLSLHKTRKDSIQLLFNLAKQEILNEKENLNKKNLDKFISILELNAAQPLVGKWTKRLIIVTTIVLTITVIIIFTWDPYIKPGIEKIKTKIGETYTSLIDKLIQDASRISTETLNNADLQNRVSQIAQQAINNLNLPEKIDELNLNERLSQAINQAVENLNLPENIDNLNLNERLSQAINHAIDNLNLTPQIQQAVQTALNQAREEMGNSFGGRLLFEQRTENNGDQNNGGGNGSNWNPLNWFVRQPQQPQNQTE
ncbi:MAG: hypothetical protein ABIA74_04000 [bacterium]